MFNIKSEVVRFSEEELKDYIRINKDPEDSMISYYMNSLSSFFNEEKNKVNIKVIIHEEFNFKSDYYDLSKIIEKYSLDNTLSSFEKTELLNKAKGIMIVDSTFSVNSKDEYLNKFEDNLAKVRQKYFQSIRDKLVTSLLNFSIRGKLFFHYQLLFNYDKNVLKANIEFHPLSVHKDLDKLQKKNYWIYKEWLKKNDIILFGNKARMEINFCDLSTQKMQEIQFFLLNVLNKSYVVTDYRKVHLPLKISSLQELIENERSIRFKLANSEDITDHPDISFSFAERYLYWLQKNINHDNIECFTFFSNYYNSGVKPNLLSSRRQDSYFNKMGLSIILDYHEIDSLMSIDFYFFVNGNDENGTIDFYCFNKKVKSCAIKNSAHFAKECRDYINEKVEYHWNHWLVKLILKYRILNNLVVKPLKSKHVKRLGKSKLIFNGYYSLEMFNEKRLPIALKCKKTEFDLSRKESVWKIEEYEEELLSAVERQELKEVLSSGKSDIIPSSQESQPVKLTNKVNRL